jgi:hypothetical protein
MKLNIKRVGGGPVTLEEFADRHGLEMEVHERQKHIGLRRYYAHFKDAEVGEGGMLIGTAGNGDTPEEAIADYADEIAGRRLVIRAARPERRELECPNEWLTPPSKPSET